MEKVIILIDGLPLSEEETQKVILTKLLNTENGRRVLLAEGNEPDGREQDRKL